MPRPRVRIEDRQRAVKACIPCKTSKKRCDAKTPCSSCVKRNCEYSCIYKDLNGLTARSSSSASSRCSTLPPGRKSQHQKTLNINQHQHAEHSQIDTIQPPEISVHEIIPPDDNQASIVDEPRHDESGLNEHVDVVGQSVVPAEPISLPQSRLMLNASGEKVYIGKTAALAFLHFLRQILSQHMGPSQFTQSKRGNVMLEAQVHLDESVELEDTLEQKRTLVGNFFLASNGMLYLFSKSEMNEFLENTTSAHVCGSLNDSILNLVLAVGAQNRPNNPRNAKLSHMYFTRGQQDAFSGSLENPSITVIWSFLLMAFYLMGACRRNGAFMYLGIAARAAHALGLHETDQYSGLSESEQSIRLRTWKSLRILDVITSSILARPLASVSTRPEIRSKGVARSTHTPSTPALDAIFELCSIIEMVLRHISRHPNLDVASTQILLQKLSHWSTNLPAEARICSISTTINSPEHEQALGNIHVACMYYFTVMLLTRPFLIRHLMSRLPRFSSSQEETWDAGHSTESSELAQVSIDAAMFTAQICRNALTAGLLLDSMCILKAWIFAAGLVLGFTMFATVEVESEAENAFMGIRDVLKKLSHQSPQAEHYHDILSSFSEAINKRRQQVARERKRVTSKYLDQLLVFDTQQGQHQSATSTSPHSDSHNYETASIEDWWNSSVPFAPGTLENPPDILTANWDTFAIQISETLAYDNNGFPEMFGAV